MPRSRSPNERSYVSLALPACLLLRSSFEPDSESAWQRDDHDRRRDRRSYRSTRSRSPPHRTTSSSSSSRRRSRSRDRDYGREQERERSYGRASRPRDDDDREPSASASSSRREHNAGPVSKASQDKKETADEVAEPTGPNFGLSGKLAAETNTVKGVVRIYRCVSLSVLVPRLILLLLLLKVLKYNEPPEARKPSKTWRLYVFKGKEQVGRWLPVLALPRLMHLLIHTVADMFHINKQSCYLLGRDRMVSLLCPSCRTCCA